MVRAPLLVLLPILVVEALHDLSLTFAYSMYSLGCFLVPISMQSGLVIWFGDHKHKPYLHPVFSDSVCDPNLRTKATVVENAYLTENCAHQQHLFPIPRVAP